MADMDNNMEMDYERDLVTLMDEEGTEHEFEVIDSLEHDGEEYLALIPVFEKPEESLDDSGELVILKIAADEDSGEEFLEAIEDEEEFNKIADIFMERLEDYFDFEE